MPSPQRFLERLALPFLGLRLPKLRLRPVLVFFADCNPPPPLLLPLRSPRSPFPTLPKGDLVPALLQPGQAGPHAGLPFGTEIFFFSSRRTAGGSRFTDGAWTLKRRRLALKRRQLTISRRADWPMTRRLAVCSDPSVTIEHHKKKTLIDDLVEREEPLGV